MKEEIIRINKKLGLKIKTIKKNNKIKICLKDLKIF